MTDYSVFPAPILSIAESGERVSTSQKDEQIYQSSEFYPTLQAVVDSRAVLRGVPVSRLRIYPFQWNPGTGELRYATRLRLEIRFQNPLPVADHESMALQSLSKKDSIQEILPGLIANYSPPVKSISPAAAIASLAAPEEKPFLKVETGKEGLYRVSFEDLSPYLLDAGVDPGSIDPATFRLFHRDTETAIHVVSTGNRFSAGDSIEFYGRKIDTPFTGINVYRLYWGEEPGKRIILSDGSLSGQGMPISSFFSRLHGEENHTIWEGMPDALDGDYWFLEKMTAPAAKNYTVSIPSPDPASATATVRVCFRGRSTSSPHPNHHTVIDLNGARIGDAFWDGDGEFIQEMTISPQMLNTGSNAFRIALPGDTGAAVDIVYLNWIEIHYHRLLEAIQDELLFEADGDGPLQMMVEGFSRQDIRILDTTDPEQICELTGFAIEPNGTTYRAVFEDQASGRKSYYVFTEAQVKSPDSLAFAASSNLRSIQNGADYILITAREFLSAVEPLCQFRRNQGLRVKTVSVEEIYDTFSDGIFDPQAIKDFLTHAYHNWTQPAPAYLFLVGDANTDYRDYLGSGKANKVPVHLSMTGSLGITPDDNWYGCVEGEDDLPDMFIGRSPAKSTDDAAAVIQKILRYEQDQQYRPNGVLFVSDNNEASFENLNESLIATLPSGYMADRVYLHTYPQVDAATADIVSKINDGMVMVNYVGHGAVTNWAGEFLFEPPDIENLSNRDRLPFIATLNCLNGYFSQPFYYSLAEAFVAAPEKGAIACFSPSGLGYVWEHEILARKLFSLVFAQGNESLGAVAARTKISAYAEGATGDVLKTFTFFGDPACRLKRWVDPGGDPTPPPSGGGSVPPPNPAPHDNQAITVNTTVPAGATIAGNTVAAGVTVTNNGTMNNPTNNGTIAGGTLGGAIVSTGTVTDVMLASGSTLDGGLLTGNVSAQGEGAVVTNAVVDADSLTNLTIGAGCRVTENTPQNNPGLDLTEAVTGPDGRVDTQSPILVDSQGITLTLARLIETGIDNVLGDAGSHARVDDAGNAIISAANLGNVVLPSVVASVITTPEVDGVSFTASGELRIVKSHVAVTLAPASADSQSFAAALEAAGAGFSQDEDRVVTVSLPDGARMLFRFDAFALRPGVVASIAAAGASFYLNGERGNPATRCLVITYPDGITQKMPPFIHALGGFRSLAEGAGADYRITPATGVIEVFATGRLVFKGRPDYMLTEPGAPGLSLEAAGDVNHDGLGDLYLITPAGRQIIYSLPTD